MKDNGTGSETRRIAGQYTSSGLRERVMAKLAEHGLGPGNLRREDTEGMDELHVGGAAATRELAEIAGVRPGWQVLDVGAGIGGPARRLAEEYECEVTALDITEEYCQVGKLLTEWLQTSDRVGYVCASATALPFRDAIFDAVWMQFAGMNVRDKGKMAREFRRVLKPGGRFVFHEVLTGNGEPPEFPVFWADDPALSFLVGVSVWRQVLDDSGFAAKRCEDVSAAALAWYDQIVRDGKSAKAGTARLNAGVIIDRDAGLKSRNVRKNIEEGRILIYRGVFERV